MLRIADTDEYLKRMLDARRPGAEKIYSFYEHRVGLICRDPRLMLLPLDDHLVHRGDGVFETMKWIDRKMYQLDPHLRRMKRSCTAIYMAPPCPWEDIREMCLEVAKAAEHDEGYLRVLIGRGPGGFGIDPTECPVPSLHIVAYRFKPKPEETFEQGVTGFRTSIPAKEAHMATIKSTDYLPNVLMRREALEKGYDQPVCFDRDSFLAEGATENICIVDQTGTLIVPEFTNCLAGTTMVRAVELIEPEIEVRFRKVREDELMDAKEVIVVGTSNDAISMVRYNDKPIHNAKPGPVSKRMRQLLQQDLVENGITI